MESLISRLLSRYENGSISRRALIKNVAALAAASGTAATGTAAGAGFQSKHLEHVSIATEHPQRLADFYKETLNLTQHPNRPDGAIRLGLEGSERTLIVFRTGKVTGIVDHFAMAVEPFDKDALVAEFKRRNIPVSMEAEFLIRDPDGISCQLMADGSKR